MLTGPGSSVELARLIADRGARSVLVVTDGVLMKLGVVEPVLNALKEAGLAVTVFSDVEPDPAIETYGKRAKLALDWMFKLRG